MWEIEKLPELIRVDGVVSVVDCANFTRINNFTRTAKAAADAMLARGNGSSDSLSVRHCCDKWGTVDGDADDDDLDDEEDEAEHAGEAAALSLLRLPKTDGPTTPDEVPMNSRIPAKER